MPDSPAVRSARGHVALYEEKVARRKRDIETGAHVIDEATTRRWLAMDEAELTTWRRQLDKAIAEEQPVVPLA